VKFTEQLPPETSQAVGENTPVPFDAQDTYGDTLVLGVWPVAFAVQIVVEFTGMGVGEQEAETLVSNSRSGVSIDTKAAPPGFWVTAPPWTPIMSG